MEGYFSQNQDSYLLFIVRGELLQLLTQTHNMFCILLLILNLVSLTNLLVWMQGLATF